MTALLRSLPLWTGWLTKGHLMVVWRENHTFHSGGLDHSVKKLSFPRQSSISFPFSENSRHFATLPLVFPPNEVWKTINQISHAARPIRGTTQIWVVTRHQYWISALVCQTSFGGETSGSVTKCRLFSQARSALEAVVLRPRGGESVRIKSRNFDAAVGNYVIVSLAAILDFLCVRKISDWVESTHSDNLNFENHKLYFKHCISKN